MIVYFIVFVAVGYMIAKISSSSKSAFVSILGFAFVWGLISGPLWGLVTFAELMMGFGIRKFIVEGDA